MPKEIKPKVGDIFINSQGGRFKFLGELEGTGTFSFEVVPPEKGPNGGDLVELRYVDKDYKGLINVVGVASFEDGKWYLRTAFGIYGPLNEMTFGEINIPDKSPLEHANAEIERLKNLMRLALLEIEAGKPGDAETILSGVIGDE